jgi:hypothetical protein
MSYARRRRAGDGVGQGCDERRRLAGETEGRNDGDPRGARGGRPNRPALFLGWADVSGDTGGAYRRLSGAGAVVLVAVVVALVGLCIWALGVKGVRLPEFSFPADHGVPASGSGSSRRR